MEIKGVSVRAAPDYVSRYHGAQFNQWLDSLSPPSRKIMENILVSSWYPLDTSVIEPTRKVCDLFFSGDEKGAFEIGKTSAKLALSGIYKVFVKVGSPEFILKRASRIFTNVLRPGEMCVTRSSGSHAVLRMNLPESDRLLELRMAGWMEQALIISGTVSPQVTIAQSIVDGNSVTDFVAQWH